MTDESIKLSLEFEPFLNEDQITYLDALVKSPVYGVLCKLMRMQKQQAVYRMIGEADKDELLQFQGYLRGLNVVENLPRIISDQFGERVQKQKDAAEAKSRKPKK